MNDGDEVEFPTSHEFALKDHLKVISALAVVRCENSVRFVGGMDPMSAIPYLGACGILPCMRSLCF